MNEIRQTRFLQQGLHVDIESDETYLILIEVDNATNKPIGSFIVKMPEEYRYCIPLFHYYPDFMN